MNVENKPTSVPKSGVKAGVEDGLAFVEALKPVPQAQQTSNDNCRKVLVDEEVSANGKSFTFRT